MERQIITVDIAPGNNKIERLKSSQGDIGRPLGVHIIQNGVALDCSSYTADLYILKPDGNFFTGTATVDATEHNLITWETAEQETPVAGDCAAQIRILNNGDDIGTARFVEYVEASPGFCGESSESVIDSLKEYVRQAAASAETASGAASSASGSASAASGSASSAASSASAAAGSASTAHTDAETASQAAQTAQDVADSIPEDYSTLSDDVTGLKSAFDYKIESITENTNNLFNPEWLLVPTGWEENDGVFFGTAQAMYDTYKATATPFPFSGFKANTQYTFSLKGKSTGSITTSQCFRIVINYTDGTSEQVCSVFNSWADYNYTYGVSAENKTISSVNVTYGNGLGNTLYLKEVQCVEGNSATEYIPFKTAVDVIARNETAQNQKQIESISDTTQNMFNPDWLLVPTGWVENDGIYTGTAQSIWNVYKTTSESFPLTGFEENTQYAVSFDAKISGSVTTSSCFRILAKYTDGTEAVVVGVNNNVNIFTHFTGVTTLNKTVASLHVSYGDGLSNTVYLMNVQVEKGNVPTDYVPFFTAVDAVARAGLSAQYGPTNGHEYFGERITLNNYKYDTYNTSIRIGQGQDCIVIGQYALGFSAENGTCKVTDIETNTVVTTFSMPTVDGVIPHFNTAVLGDTANDQTIPLLYVNVNTPYMETPGLCAVYQINYTGSSWSATLVQTINVPFVGDTDWGEMTRYDSVNFAVENGVFYAFGASSAKHKTNICGFNIPSHSTNITLTRSDIITQFDVGYMHCIQGCMTNDGKLYILNGLGITNNDTAELYVVDLTKMVVVSYVRIYEVMTGEPEFIFVYDDSIYFGAWDMLKLIT